MNLPIDPIIEAAQELARRGGFPTPTIFTGGEVGIEANADIQQLTAKSPYVWLRVTFSHGQTPSFRVLRWYGDRQTQLAEPIRKYEGWDAFESASRDYDLDSAAKLGEPGADITAR
jgi:hypothetical protein